jgi:hypothetical protein
MHKLDSVKGGFRSDIEPIHDQIDTLQFANRHLYHAFDLSKDDSNPLSQLDHPTTLHGPFGQFHNSEKLRRPFSERMAALIGPRSDAIGKRAPTAPLAATHLDLFAL